MLRFFSPYFMMFDTAQNVDPRKHFLLSPLKKKTNKVKKKFAF